MAASRASVRSPGWLHDRRMLGAALTAVALHLFAWIAIDGKRPLPVQARAFTPNAGRIEVHLLTKPVMRAAGPPALAPRNRPHIAAERHRETAGGAAAPRPSAAPPDHGSAVLRNRRATTQPVQHIDETLDWNRDLAGIAGVRSFRYAAQPLVAQAGTAASGPQSPPDATLESAMTRSARPDCRKRHADMGLLALPMLALDTLTESGCKW